MRTNFKKISKNIKHNRERGIDGGEMQTRRADWKEGSVGHHVHLCLNLEAAFGLEVKICLPNVFGLGSVRVKRCSNQEVSLYIRP